jgi:hypothetical protein
VIAALLNGLVVLFGGPFMYVGLSSGLPFRAALMAVAVVSPFALVAAWRTWVHARRRLLTGHGGWSGVLEAGALGFATGAVYLMPSLANPAALAPVLIYMVVATVLGLLVGLLLRMVAVGLLWALRHHAHGAG